MRSYRRDRKLARMRIENGHEHAHVERRQRRRRDLKRKHAIAMARVAGYHGRKDEYTRLCVEACGIASSRSLMVAYSEGEQARINGVGCSCRECQKKEDVA